MEKVEGDKNDPLGPGLPEADQNFRVRIDLPPAVYAGFHTLAYNNPNGTHNSFNFPFARIDKTKTMFPP